MSEQEIRELLHSFAAAWGNKDLDTVMDKFSDDCIYRASAGPEPGVTAHGYSAVRQLIAAMFEYDLDAETEVHDLIVVDDRAVWQWTYYLPDGRVEKGCDLFTVSAGKIQIKDAFRKVHHSAD